LAVGAECTVQADAFHCIVEKLVVGFGAGGFGPFIYGGKVLFTFV